MSTSPAYVRVKVLQSIKSRYRTSPPRSALSRCRRERRSPRRLRGVGVTLLLSVLRACLVHTSAIFKLSISDVVPVSQLLPRKLRRYQRLYSEYFEFKVHPCASCVYERLGNLPRYQLLGIKQLACISMGLPIGDTYVHVSIALIAPPRLLVPTAEVDRLYQAMNAVQVYKLSVSLSKLNRDCHVQVCDQFVPPCVCESPP
jgi:hypothetical protein